MRDQHGEQAPAAAASAPGAPAAAPPVIAIAYDITSSSPFELVGALGDRYEVVWVVDAGDPELGSWSRLLPRLGPVVDTRGHDVASIAERLAELGAHGIVAYSDSQLLLAAELASRLALPGNPPHVVEALTDKAVQREHLQAAGLPGPRFVAVDAAAPTREYSADVAGLSYPVVVKPRRGTGSRDTVRADDATTALARIDELLAGPDAPDVIVEELLADLPHAEPGPFADYVSVEAVAAHGTVVPLAVTGKFRLAPPFRETGNFLPHHLPEHEAQAARDLAVRAAEALGVRSGALHIEVKLTPDGPRIIEVNGRVGGGAIDAIFASVHGRSLTEIAAAIATGQSVELDPVDRSPGRGFDYAFFVQPPLEARRLTRLGNVDALRGLSGVESSNANRAVGDEIDWRAGSQGYLLSVKGVAADVDELARVPETVLSVLDVGWE